MKKKLFSLLTLLLIGISGGWGQTTLFNMEISTSVGDIKLDAGATVDLNTTTHLSALSGGSITLKNGSSSNNQKLIGSDNSERHIRLTNDAHCAIITLSNNTLAQGDIISFTGNANVEISITKTNTRATTIQTSSKAYTIPAASPLIGESTIYIWKGGGNTYIKTLTITRPASGHQISFAANGGTGTMTSHTGIEDKGSQTLKPNSFTKTGYTFANWTANVAVTANGSAVAIGGAIANEATLSNITSDIALTAQWTASNYDVTLDPDNGGSTQTVTATYDATMPSTLKGGGDLEVPTYSGYTFGGYYDDHAGSGTQYYTNAVASAKNWNKTSETTLYAKWTQTVTFDANTANHGDTDGSATATLNGTALASISHATGESGYSLTGYYTSATDGTKVLNADGTFAASSVTDYITEGKWTKAGATTLYAQWEVTATYTVTYNANGGSGVAPSDATEYAEGESVKVADNYGTLTKSGYSVVGWNTDPAATTASHAFGSSFTMGDDDVTLYAIWQENFYTFTPKVVTEAENVGLTATVLNSTGGVMNNTQTDTTLGRLQYTTNGLMFAGSSNSKVTVTLNDKMQVGSVITATFWCNDGKSDRGVDILNAAGTDKGDWYFTGDSKNHTFAYTVVSGDGFADYNSFSLKRKGNAYLKSLTVTNCQPGGTITASGYNTYSSIKPLDLSTLSSGTTAYVATEVSDGKVVLSKTTAKVPANTGLFLAGTENAPFTVNVATGETSAPAKNLLVAAPNGTTVSAANNTSEWNYVFGWADASNPGFYLIESTSASLGAGKAYLHTTTALATGGGAHGGFIFEDESGDVTGIAEVSNKKAFNGDFYNLAGQKVAQPTKGLYIVNGKKVIIK